jgi:hypothetical protein
MTLSRTILAAACFILGIVLLIPASLQLWKLLVARLAPPQIPYLPDPHTNFVLFLNGRAIGDVTVLTIATVVGAALLLAGQGIARSRQV